MSSQIKPIHTALEKLNQGVAEVASLENLLTSNATTLRGLEANCDLGDDRALTIITRLQVIESLLPRRIETKKDALPALEQGILESCYQAITGLIGPKIRSLREKAEARVRTALSPHFADPTTLAMSVSGSELLRELDNLGVFASVQSDPLGGVIPYAERILKTWESVELFEKTHLT
ncbi:MAG TPA: hypothetical protein VHY30_10360 [Verrucomicrobiae bacterium]|jgi:hypothetical protein|nr:hypothetical protein [Verrucomicrobiae bacterium]